MKEDTFEIIYVYTKEQAMEDGVLFEAGRYGGRGIVLTTNLIAALSKEEFLTALVKGFRRARAFTEASSASFEVGGRRVLIDDSGVDLTLMLPED